MPQQPHGASPYPPDERANDGRDVTTILDADATIRYVSPSIEPILGYKPEQMVGQNWFQYVHPDDAAQALPGFGQTTQQPGVVQRNALRVRHANGSWVNVEEVGSNLLHYPGVHGWILSARNIGANGSVPAVAEANGNGNAEEALAAAVQRSEQLERSRRWNMELIATLSHELRTPLNVIVGYHDLLLDGTFGTLTSEQSYTIRRAQRSAQELLDIMSATLDLTRMDGGHVRLVTQSVATADLLEELKGDLHQLSDKPGVTLQWETAPNTPKVATDPAKLKMIVKHLVRNALQLTNHGAVTVMVQPRSNGVEIAIADHGAGISHAAMTTIFGPQQQPDPAALAGFGGSGLGLYAARQLVELLGGKVAVETERATGSTVRVFLPLSAAMQRATG
jgi:PAS domain S-box-containing protein